MSDDLSGDMLAPSWPNLVCFVIPNVFVSIRYASSSEDEPESSDEEVSHCNTFRTK